MEKERRFGAFGKERQFATYGCSYVEFVRHVVFTVKDLNIYLRMSCCNPKRMYGEEEPHARVSAVMPLELATSGLLLHFTIIMRPALCQLS